MIQITTRRTKLLALLVLVAVSSLCSGCAQRNLFVDDDPAAQKKKYWDDESVRETHEVREQTRSAGFGMANGPSAQ